MVRVGLSEAVGGEQDMQVVDEAGSGFEAMERYRKHAADVVLMDYQMPGKDGVETTQQMLKDFPDAKIILLSVREGEEDIWRAIQSGIMGYLFKSSTMKEVLGAIRQVHSGSRCFSPEVEAKIKLRSTRPDLTPRELDVLRAIVEGRCNKEICTSLDISEGNVRLYVSRVLSKLGVADRTQAAVKAIQTGIVHLEH